MVISLSDFAISSADRYEVEYPIRSAFKDGISMLSGSLIKKFPSSFVTVAILVPGIDMLTFSSFFLVDLSLAIPEIDFNDPSAYANIPPNMNVRQRNSIFKLLLFIRYSFIWYYGLIFMQR